MTNKLYVMYNRLSKRYGEVLTFASDEFASYHVKQQLEQSKTSLDEYELCRVGSIDLETGVIDKTEAPIRISFDLGISALSE